MQSGSKSLEQYFVLTPLAWLLCCKSRCGVPLVLGN